MQALAGKRVVITGAGRGIGRDMALAFARAGARVAVSSRSRAELDEVVGLMEGGTGLAVVADVVDVGQVAGLQTAVANTFGGCDILINNAGTARSHRFVDHPDALWHQMLNVNLTGVYNVTKAFVPGMVGQKWGRIINVASIASKVGSPYIAAYVAAKHGVLGLTRALAAELVRYQITVNAICPGYVDTPLTDGSVANIMAQTEMTEGQARKVLENMSPQKRLMTVEEVTAVALMLAQETARGITGQGINVDGGAVMF